MSWKFVKDFLFKENIFILNIEVKMNLIENV